MGQKRKELICLVLLLSDESLGDYGLYVFVIIS